MAEYVEKAKLYENISHMEEVARNRFLDTPWDSPARTRYQAQLNERTSLKHMVADMKAADVAPVVHAHYENGCCTNCGRQIATDCWGGGMDKNNYCYYCGARMDGDAH